VLKKSPVLGRLCDQAKQNTLDLSHLSESAAHALVHHLYTGSYQSLEPKEIPPTGRGVARFKSALSVYAVARAYALPDLEAAAKSEVKRLAEDLPVSDRLSAAMEAYPDLGEDDTWFLDYLKTCIRGLFQGLPRPLRYDSLGFLGHVSMFVKAIVKNAIEISWETPAVSEHLNVAGKRHAATEGFELVSASSTCESREDEAVASEEHKPEAINLREGSTKFGAFPVPTTEARPLENGGTNAAALDSPYQPRGEPDASLSQDRTLNDCHQCELERDGNETSSVCAESDLRKPMINPQPNHKASAQNGKVRPVVSTENSHSSASTREMPEVANDMARATVKVICLLTPFHFVTNTDSLRSRILLHLQTFTSWTNCTRSMKLPSGRPNLRQSFKKLGTLQPPRPLLRNARLLPSRRISECFIRSRRNQNRQRGNL